MPFMAANIDEKIGFAADSSIHELIQQQRESEENRGSKLVMKLGGLQRLQGFLRSCDLKSQSVQMDYLMSKLIEHLVKDCLNAAKMISNQVGAQTTPSQQTENPEATEVQKQTPKLKIEDKYAEAIYLLFQQSQVLNAQTQRIKDECLSKHFFGALSDKQRKVLALLAEKQIISYLQSVSDKMKKDIESTSENLQFYLDIVNMQLSPEYIHEQKSMLGSKVKFLQAYGTLIHRMKQRTDGFVLQNIDLLRQQSSVIQALPETLAAQMDTLLSRLPLERQQSFDQRHSLLETLRRAAFLQRNLIEGTQYGLMYLQQAYDSGKMAEITDALHAANLQVENVQAENVLVANLQGTDQHGSRYKHDVICFYERLCSVMREQLGCKEQRIRVIESQQDREYRAMSMLLDSIRSYNRDRAQQIEDQHETLCSRMDFYRRVSTQLANEGFAKYRESYEIWKRNFLMPRKPGQKIQLT